MILNSGSVVEWLKGRACDQDGLGLKPTRAILLCPWERHFTALRKDTLRQKTYTS